MEVAPRFLVDALLRRMVVGNRERLHLFQGEIALAIGFKNGWADAGELEALLHRRLADAESRRDVGGSGSVLDQGAVGLELVRRMHWRTHHVGGQPELGGVNAELVNRRLQGWGESAAIVPSDRGK